MHRGLRTFSFEYYEDRHACFILHGLSFFVIAANGIHSDEDENYISKSSASVTSDMHDAQKLYNFIHRQPLDLSQSNANTTSTPPLSHAEPDEFCCSTDASCTRSEGQTGSSLETSNGPRTIISDVQKENGAKYTDTVNNELPLKHQMNNGSDSFPLNNDVFVSEKHPVKFKGIGPTDEETGIPIASRTVSNFCFLLCFSVLLSTELLKFLWMDIY